MNLALFGGTFDPPHCGHLQIAAAAVQECRLDKVIFLPCHQSPHKASPPQASGPQRLAMLQLATARAAWAEVSAWELQRAEPSFSWQTAEHFATQFPGAKLHWLLGEDQWQALDRWSRPEHLAKLLTFIVFPRAGQTPTPNPRFKAHFLAAEFPGRATEIRAALQAGRAAAHLPASVAQYIAEQKLYAPESQPAAPT